MLFTFFLSFLFVLVQFRFIFFFMSFPEIANRFECLWLCLFLSNTVRHCFPIYYIYIYIFAIRYLLFFFFESIYLIFRS